MQLGIERERASHVRRTKSPLVENPTASDEMERQMFRQQERLKSVGGAGKPVEKCSFCSAERPNESTAMPGNSIGNCAAACPIIVAGDVGKSPRSIVEQHSRLRESEIGSWAVRWLRATHAEQHALGCDPTALPIIRDIPHGQTPTENIVATETKMISILPSTPPILSSDFQICQESL